MLNQAMASMRTGLSVNELKGKLKCKLLLVGSLVSVWVELGALPVHL